MKDKKEKSKPKVRDINSFKPEDRKDILAVQAVESGKDAKFLRITERYRPFLEQRFFLKVRDREVARDLAADVLVKVYEKVKKGMYKPTFTFNSWFYMVADRFLIDWSRKGSYKLRKSTSSYANLMTNSEGGTITFEETMPDDSQSDARILEDERKNVVREALLSLDEEGRNLVSMFYAKNMSYDDIAKELNINTNTMRGHLMKAKQKIAQFIIDKYPEFKIRSMDNKKLTQVESETVTVDGEEFLRYFAV